MCGFYKTIPPAPHLWLPPRWSVLNARVFEVGLVCARFSRRRLQAGVPSSLHARLGGRTRRRVLGALWRGVAGSVQPAAGRSRPESAGEETLQPRPSDGVRGPSPAWEGRRRVARTLAIVSGGAGLDRYTARSSSPLPDHPGSALTLLSGPARLSSQWSLSCRAPPDAACRTFRPSLESGPLASFLLSARIS